MTNATAAPVLAGYAVKAMPELEVREMSRDEYLTRLGDLCGAIDDPTFLEPPEVPLEYGASAERMA